MSKKNEANTLFVYDDILSLVVDGMVLYTSRRSGSDWPLFQLYVVCRVPVCLLVRACAVRRIVRARQSTREGQN